MIDSSLSISRIDKNALSWIKPMLCRFFDVS